MSYYVHTLSRRDLLAGADASEFDAKLAAYINGKSAEVAALSLENGNITIVFHAPPSKSK